jgi:hypothetical protein
MANQTTASCNRDTRAESGAEKSVKTDGWNEAREGYSDLRVCIFQKGKTPESEATSSSAFDPL